MLFQTRHRALACAGVSVTTGVKPDPKLFAVRRLVPKDAAEQLAGVLHAHRHVGLGVLLRPCGDRPHGLIDAALRVRRRQGLEDVERRPEHRLVVVAQHGRPRLAQHRNRLAAGRRVVQQPDTGQVHRDRGRWVWFCARLRAIAAEARIGAALAGAYEATPEGLLPEPGSYHSPPGSRRGPLRLRDAPGPEAGPDTVARANGHARASSVAAPRPPAPSCAPSSDCLPGAAVPAPDDDIERREEAIADCTEAIRRDPGNPRLYLERASLRSELVRHEEAVEDYDRLVRLDPDSAAALAEG